MGIGSILFGSKPKTETASLGLLSPEQDQLLRETLIPFLSQPISEVREDIPDLSSLESTSLAGLEQLALSGRGTETVDAASKFIQDLLSGGQGLEQEFFEQNVQAPLLEGFREDILPSISRTFASDFFSSDRAKADTRAMEELIQQLVRGRSDVALRGRDQRIGAAGLAPGLDGFGIERLLAFLKAGGVEREQKRFGFEREDARLQQILEALGLRTKENVVTVLGGSQGLAPSIIKAGGALGAAAITASARDLKENFKPVGRVLDKIKSLVVERWHYKGDDVEHIGPMAGDFSKAFGGDSRGIDIISMFGILLKASQELLDRVETLEGQGDR